MEVKSKTKNIIKIACPKTDYQKLDRTLKQIPNPIAKSPIDLIKRLIKQIDTLLKDQPDSNIQSTDNHHDQSMIGLFDQNDQDVQTIHNANLVQCIKQCLNPSFTNSDDQPFDRHFNIKIEPTTFQRLIKLFNYNEKRMCSFFATYLIRINQTKKIITDHKSPTLINHEGTQFTYQIGSYQNSILNDDNRIPANVTDVIQYTDELVHSKFEKFLTYRIKLDEHKQYLITQLQNQYIERIQDLRQKISQANVDNLYINQSNRETKPIGLSAYDYLNVFYAHVIGHAAYGTDNDDDISGDANPITLFLLQKIQELLNDHYAGTANQLLFRYGDQLDKAAEVELLKNQHQPRLLTFETEDRYGYYSNKYNVDNLKPMNPQTFKTNLLETFSFKNINQFKSYLDQHSDWRY